MMSFDHQLDALLKNTGDMCLKRRARLLLSELNPKKTDTILDVGCGDGFYLYLISKLGNYDLVGIDDNASSVEAAKEQVGKKSAKYIVGDLLKMPLQANSINKIVCSEVLEHLDDPVKGLTEMKRVLKRKGQLFVTVPHLHFPFFWDPINWILQNWFKTHIKEGFWAGVWNMHIRLYTVQQLKNEVQKAGFKIEKIECLTHYGLPFNHYLTNIGFRLRTSKNVSEEVKKSMSKFHPDSKKTWFTYVLEFINKLDKRNNRHFSSQVSTVGIYLRARKI